MPSGDITPKSTITPAISLPARPPYWNSPFYPPPTTYQIITTRRDFNSYIYIWFKNNMEDEHASEPEKDLYSELVEKYG